MNFRNALLAATMLALPVAANAQPITGLYIGAWRRRERHAGENRASLPRRSSRPRQRYANSTRSLARLPSSASAMGFGNGLRAEIEGDFRYNYVQRFNRRRRRRRQEQKFGGMVNVLYDFVGLVPYVQPYVGVGAGYQWAQEQNLHA